MLMQRKSAAVEVEDAIVHYEGMLEKSFTYGAAINVTQNHFRK